LTPSPSEPAETLTQLDQEQHHLPETAAIDQDAAVLVPTLTRLSGGSS
jgi:hypothetical protein